MSYCVFDVYLILKTHDSDFGSNSSEFYKFIVIYWWEYKWNKKHMDEMQCFQNEKRKNYMGMKKIVRDKIIEHQC